jgi:hypothetical protein
MKKLSILAIFAMLVSFSSCNTASTVKEEEKKEDSTVVLKKVDTAEVKVDTAAAEH